jgi:iron complex transport system substrate-binding protein
MTTQDTTDRTEAPTRRDYVKYGGTIAVGGFLAGCTGDGGSDSEPESTPEDSETDTSDDPTETDRSYSVRMEPVGDVTFESVPEEFVAHKFSQDVAIAVGHADSIVESVANGGYFTAFYEMLPDVEVPDNSAFEGIRTGDSALSKEQVYEIDPELIGIDPNWLLTWAQAEPSDIDELTRNVAPFFGNFSREKRASDWANWPDGEYAYYDLYELTDFWGQVFQEQERAEAVVEMNQSLVENVRSQLPSDDERPSVALPHAIAPRGGEIWAYNPASDITKTYGKKQYRDLNVRDALAGMYDGAARVTFDAEAMLEADPDVIFLHFALAFFQTDATEFFDSSDAEGSTVVDYTIERYKTDPVLSEITAVKNDRIYAGTNTSHGPIINMFNTEVVAKQLYPDIFGEWPGFNDDGTYDIPEEEQLFDRQRVADIANGAF